MQYKVLLIIKKHMEKNEALNTLNEIRDMMAKSSKVLSLSGTSSVFVGVPPLTILRLFVSALILYSAFRIYNF